MKRYLNVALLVYDILRTVPTIDIFSMAWNAWLETVEHIWQEPNVRAYLQGHCSAHTAAELRDMFHIPSQASDTDLLSFGFHWVGLAGTRPGTGSGSQSAEAFHSGWKRDLQALGQNASLHDILLKMQSLYKGWQERLPYANEFYTTKCTDTNPHLLHSTQLLKVGTNPAYHLGAQREHGNHVRLIDTEDGAAVAVSFSANETISPDRAQSVHNLLGLGGADLRSALVDIGVLQRVPGKESTLHLNVASFVECFSSFHFVFLKGEAHRFHTDYDLLRTCTLFAMHADCPCSQFARALPWLCRAPDLILHQHPTRKALAKHLTHGDLRPAGKAEARKGLRQLLLQEPNRL